MSGIFEHLGAGEKSPEIINVFVEIARGSQNKYEFDKEAGGFRLDRVLYSPMHYPLDYGFVPQTLSEDGDPLDVLILGSDPVFPGCVVSVRPIGLLKMIDSGDLDYKILGVQHDNPRFDNIKTLEDIKISNPHLLREIAHFFAEYKRLQGKITEVTDWMDTDFAKNEIKKATANYKNGK